MIEKQNKEIQKILKELSKKANDFAKRNKGKQYDDLGTVLRELKDVNKFLSNE